MMMVIVKMENISYEKLWWLQGCQKLEIIIVRCS
jgi:hypothetical protein